MLERLVDVIIILFEDYIVSSQSTTQEIKMDVEKQRMQKEAELVAMLTTPRTTSIATKAEAAMQDLQASQRYIYLSISSPGIFFLYLSIPLCRYMSPDSYY
tara:strand:- start:476 stop:778 length:303 start_codon:yes stop_codon:yes gene_type:complete